MTTPARLRPKDLAVGHCYLHINGFFVRQIDALEGDTVLYHDQYGQGRCSRGAFLRLCPSLAPKEAQARAEEERRVSMGAELETEFTLRDEANALTAYAFRNGFLEDLHAGKWSPLLDQPGLSRITDEEMRQLMIEASAKLAEMLRLKQQNPAQYEVFIRAYHQAFCRVWKRS